MTRLRAGANCCQSNVSPISGVSQLLNGHEECFRSTLRHQTAAPATIVARGVPASGASPLASAASSTPRDSSSRFRRSAKPGPACRRGRGSPDGEFGVDPPASSTTARSASSSASSTSCVTSSTAGPVAQPKRGHQRLHAQPRQRIQRRERLVEQQQFGLAHQSAGEAGALRLAAGQGERPGIDAVGEPDLPQRCRARGRAGPRRASPAPRCAKPVSRAAAAVPGTPRRDASAPRGDRARTGSRPASVRSSVVLPDPLRPSSATNSPAAICRSS